METSRKGLRVGPKTHSATVMSLRTAVIGYLMMVRLLWQDMSRQEISRPGIRTERNFLSCLRPGCCFTQEADSEHWPAPDLVLDGSLWTMTTKPVCHRAV